jgi:hypothetical protein
MDTIENAHLNVKKQKQYVETIKENEMKNVMTEKITELQIARTNAQTDVQ